MKYHYENMPMQYTEIFKVVKNENFSLENICYFSYFAQNRLWVHVSRGGSNEHPPPPPPPPKKKKKKKNRYIPAYASFAI